MAAERTSGGVDEIENLAAGFGGTEPRGHPASPRHRLTRSEGLLFCARSLARVHAQDFALSLLDRVVDGGVSCSRALVHDPWFDSLRAEPRFIRILHRAEAKTADAATAFAQAGGERLLGRPS